MDLKTFAEADFDPKKWINKAWSSSGNQEKEVFVANAVSRLQLYMKQLTNSLDETTSQIVTSLPRVIQEAEILQEEGLQLQQQLLALEMKVQGVEEQTGQSIESLNRIDKLKSKLENAASTLQEADKWAVLTSSLENLLESGVSIQADKVGQLAEQVAAMSHSLEALSNAPDYDSKRMQLETLFNRLEALISPPLIEALTQMDSDRVFAYVSVFRGMCRSASVCRCWRRAGAARLAAAWRRRDVHSQPALAALLATDATKQMEWLTNVLQSDTPLAELVRLYTDLLLSIDPSPVKLATANLKLCSTPEEGIAMIIDLRRDIDELVSCIKKMIDTPKQNKEMLSAVVEREFGRAAYMPLRELLPKYSDLQTQLFLQYQNDPQLKEEDLIEYSRGLLTIAGKCDGWLTSAYSKAKKIAGIASYPFYVPAVENLIAKLSTHIAAHGRQVESEFLASVSAGKATGVLSDTFAASLILESTTAVLLDTLAERHKVESAEEMATPSSPLEDMVTLLLDAEGKQRLASFRAEPPMSAAMLRRNKEHLSTLSKNILKQPIDTALEKVPQLSVWNNNDALSTELPDFALSPQEYITEVGQYLMTLPQHLEMYLSVNQTPWQYLTEVCLHACDIYAEKILNIRNMDELGTKRCLTDILYLSSVVEDLGSSLTPALKSLETSFKAATSQVSQTSE